MGSTLVKVNTMEIKRTFGSDNFAGGHTDIIKSIMEANKGHVTAYGNDDYTKRAIDKFREHLGDVDVYFVFNGTAANVIGLSAMTKPFNSIICPETSHLNLHEAGAPEKYAGCKLIAIKSEDGKITSGQIKKYLNAIGDQHSSQPKVISITQATDYGTVYTLQEMKELADFAHKNNMLLHVDGARICNAAASLGVSLKEITAGIDILSFGGTKNGMLYGEAVVLFNRALTENFNFIRKQGMQLASKMRFISCQFEAMLSNNLWLKSAQNANEMAKLLAKEVEKLGIKITQKVEANMVFAILPKKIIKTLQDKSFFYVINEEIGEVRLVTSFDTKEEDIGNFVKEIKNLI